MKSIGCRQGQPAVVFLLPWALRTLLHLQPLHPTFSHMARSSRITSSMLETTPATSGVPEIILLMVCSPRTLPAGVLGTAQSRGPCSGTALGLNSCPKHCLLKCGPAPPASDHLRVCRKCRLFGSIPPPQNWPPQTGLRICFLISFPPHPFNSEVSSSQI